MMRFMMDPRDGGREGGRYFGDRRRTRDHYGRETEEHLHRKLEKFLKHVERMEGYEAAQKLYRWIEEWMREEERRREREYDRDDGGYD